MFSVGWSELFIVGAVALIVIGPKDMPKVMGSLGRWARKARAFSHEMQKTFDQVAGAEDPAVSDDRASKDSSTLPPQKRS